MKPMTVAQIIREKLDELGADGLMTIPNKHGSMLIFKKEEITLALEIEKASELIPAYRHADGTYHSEPDLAKPCDLCEKEDCDSELAELCQAYLKWKKHWLSHKEATK